MKTKRILMILLVFMMIWTTKSYASHVHLYLDSVTTTPSWHYFCNIDSVIVYEKSDAITTNYFRYEVTGDNYPNLDSMVIITSTQSGEWRFSSPETGAWFFYIYSISSPPIEPTCMVHDTSFCTATFSLPLDAQNQNPGGHAATYLWSTGATTRTMTVTTPGYYWVIVTNACGVDTFDITITQSNPNAPDLGSNQSFCWGSSSVLDPGSTNVASYQWSTGSTSPTITVDTTGNYWVYLIDNNGCSGRDTVQVTALLPIDEQICFVEFDTVTWKNNVNWTSNLPGNADSVRIYKEDGINWVPIGTVYKTTTHFLDMASNPQAQSYSYKIAVIDTCGNESSLSSYHKTITLLSAYDQPSNTYGFTWSFYEGLVVTYYYLYGIDVSNNVHLVATVNGSVQMYNYVGPNPAYIKYFVGFETPDCNGAKANVIVKSNWIIKDPLITGTEELAYIPFQMYPNPATNQIELSINATNFDVQLINVLGQVLLTEHNQKMIDISMLPKGTYIVRLQVDNAISQQKIILQ